MRYRRAILSFWHGRRTSLFARARRGEEVSMAAMTSMRRDIILPSRHRRSPHNGEAHDALGHRQAQALDNE